MKNKTCRRISIVLVCCIVTALVALNIVATEQITSSRFASVPMIAVGNSYTVALDSNGIVWSWGANWFGQLGNGTMTDSTIPVQVNNLNNVIAIDAGAERTVALRYDGTVWAWGANNKGELGNNTTTNSSVPVQTYGITNVIAIAAGWYHTIALRYDGTIWTWGANAISQGHWTTYDTTPVQVKGINNVIAIEAGSTHSIALREDGTVWKWQLEQYGIPGTGAIPIQVQNLNNITAVATGDSYGIALKDDGTVWGWGIWTTTGLPLDIGTTPVQIKNLDNVVAICAGIENAMALREDGTVWRLSVHHHTSRERYIFPTQEHAQSLSGITAIATTGSGTLGGGHSVALRYDGTVWIWRLFGGLVQVPDSEGIGFLNLGQSSIPNLPKPPPQTIVPIIVIPGIMGSSLSHNGNIVWLHTGEFPIIGSSRLYRLAQYSDGRSVNSIYPRQGVYGVNEGLLAFVASNTALPYYNMMTALRYTFGEDMVHFFAYDWRMDNADTAILLRQFIESDVVGNPTQVKIVAHSMGGLVAARFIADGHGDRIRQLVTLGTPYLGATKTPYVFSTGNMIGPFLGLHLRPQSIMRLSSHMTSAYQLLPYRAPNYYIWTRDRAVSRFDLQPVPDSHAFIRDIMSLQNPIGNQVSTVARQNFLNSSTEFMSSLFLPDGRHVIETVNHYVIVGANHSTVSGTIFSPDGRYVNHLTFTSGDQTVPLWSATINNRIHRDSITSFNYSHTEMVYRLRVIRHVVDVLNGARIENAGDISSNSGRVVINVASPVDVSIEHNGETLSTAYDSLISRTSFGSLYFVGSTGTTAIFALNKDVIYDVFIVGTAYGTMDYSISFYDTSDNLIEERFFVDVPITPNTRINTNTAMNIATNLRIDTNGDGNHDIVLYPNIYPPVSTIQVIGISIAGATTHTLTVGQTLQLTANVIPANATNQNITWTSSNTTVATVSATGQVTANSAGTANITVRTADGNHTAMVTITVTTAEQGESNDDTSGDNNGSATGQPSPPVQGRPPTPEREIYQEEEPPTVELPIIPPTRPVLPLPPRPFPFTDITTTAWYYPSVRAVWEHGLFQGTAPNIFSPGQGMTRAMFVQVLANREGINTTGFTRSSFNDVATTSWYFGAVEWAVQMRIVEGVGNGNFAPNQPINREEMAVMLHRYANVMGITLPWNAGTMFADQNHISPWAVNGVNAMQRANIIFGRPNGNFDPQATATRAEVATLFARFLDVTE